MKRSLAVIVLILFVLPLTVAAQDATPTLTPEGEPVGTAPAEGLLPTVEVAPADGVPTLELVTSEPASFYGQELTLDGVVSELVNIRSFVLGEGAALDDDQVLVLNNSGQEFSIDLTRDASVQVTGTIYPAWDQGGWDQVMMLPMGGIADVQAGTTGDQSGDVITTEEAVTEEAEMTTSEAMEETEAPLMEPNQVIVPGVTLAAYPTTLLEQRFPSHTLLVIDSADDIAFVEPAPEQ